MVTESEAISGTLTARIDAELAAAAADGKIKINEAREAIFRVLRWCGFTFVNGDNSPAQTGIIDQHRGTPVLLCMTPGGALIRPLRVGESVNLYDRETGSDRTIEVVADESGRPRLDVGEDAAVFGELATVTALLPGTENLKFNPINGQIEQIKKIKGGAEDA